MIEINGPAETPGSRINYVYNEVAFMDRGVRFTSKAGERCALLKLSDVPAAVAASPPAASPLIGVVWNTGRCGSTLIHKTAIAAGGVSLSEPHWMDQLRLSAEAVGAEGSKVVYKACVDLEVALSQLRPEGVYQPGAAAKQARALYYPRNTLNPLYETLNPREGPKPAAKCALRIDMRALP